jgi:hypothetical protein
MAYGDECPLVGLNYVRAAATNLALADATSAVNLSHLASPSIEKLHNGIKHVPLEMPRPLPVLTNLPNDAPEIPSFAAYDDPKANSSLLKRLAEKFGLH